MSGHSRAVLEAHGFGGHRLLATVKLHELRHSAADNLWRETGKLMLAQRSSVIPPSQRRRLICTRRGKTSPTHSPKCKLVRSEEDETA